MSSQKKNSWLGRCSNNQTHCCFKNIKLDRVVHSFHFRVFCAHGIFSVALSLSFRSHYLFSPFRPPAFEASRITKVIRILVINFRSVVEKSYRCISFFLKIVVSIYAFHYRLRTKGAIMVFFVQLRREIGFSNPSVDIRKMI
jgi:hypothetical protein